MTNSISITQAEFHAGTVDTTGYDSVRVTRDGETVLHISRQREAISCCDESRDAIALLRRIEHVKLPGMLFSRCPVCLSPNDPSEPHEYGCELARLIAGYE